MAATRPQQPVLRAAVVHPYLRRGGAGTPRTPEASLAEAVGLTEAIGVPVAFAETAPLAQFRPATLLGGGKVSDLAQRLEAAEVGLLIVDAALSPIQQRNLEKDLNCKVLDRTGLILEIFGERARTKEGALQVELAHLSYQRSRLVRSWTHLERQRGGFGFLGGPGESQIEIDRRLIDERIIRLKKDLEAVANTRSLHRRRRRRNETPVISLVGYTNAGKSTLFNRLTKAGVLAEDMLFATLDPTMRTVRLPSGNRAILSDTVGFIADLPTHLVAAFRATLEEVLEADLVLHVRDVAHPDSAAQKADVESVLGDLGFDLEKSDNLLVVLNKIDLLPPDRAAELRAVADRHDEVAISAETGEGCDRLLAVIEERLSARHACLDLTLDTADGAALAWLYRNARVLDRHDEGHNAHVKVDFADATLERFRRRYPQVSIQDPA
jgi:GTP-binding protein HflX